MRNDPQVFIHERALSTPQPSSGRTVPPNINRYAPDEHARLGWRGRFGISARQWLGLALLVAFSVARCLAAPETTASGAGQVSYQNYRLPDGPFSIHVIRVPRAGSTFQLLTMHATGRAVGLGALSEQISEIDPAAGTAV